MSYTFLFYSLNINRYEILLDKVFKNLSSLVKKKKEKEIAIKIKLILYLNKIFHLSK